MLVAALAFAGCNNKKQKNEEPENKAAETVVEEVKLPNRLLIIVDPQVDFTTGSLATAKGPASMDYLAKALKEDKTLTQPITARLLSKVACSRPTACKAPKA